MLKQLTVDNKTNIRITKITRFAKDYNEKKDLKLETIKKLKKKC